MKQDDAMDLLIKRYGLLKGAKLLQFAAMLQGVGPEYFDGESSRQNRSLLIGQMRDAGVYWDAVEFDAGYIAMWVRLMKRMRKRRTA